ncbi:MAG: signal peptidase I [Spirochaetales bacterium]|nr:signal peptidase I [Spirochaetales bacterium]
MDVNSFLLTLKKKTETFLTWRKRRKLKKKEKLKQKNAALDWAEAFLSAVVIVFFLNQYLLQAYQIPSESMVNTLLIGDRIFVDKMTFGPELLPGVVKFPGFRSVRRGDIAIFESPEYVSKGTAYDIVTRIVYMMTFSFIDLDRDEKGEPAKHFLIKRIPCVPGDRLKMSEGLLEIMPPGSNEWIQEEKLKSMSGIHYTLNTRRIKDEEYVKFHNAGTGFARLESGLEITEEQEMGLSHSFFSKTAMNEDELTTIIKEIERGNSAVYLIVEDSPVYTVWGILRNFDRDYVEKIRYRTLSEIRPHDTQVKKEWLKNDLGRYIPKGYIFPMGDNRDNSRDARVFGPVKIEKVLGKSLFRFWPFNRFGGI